MFVVSFYSFKGGVGRTIALVNSAWHLADRGSRIALLDLDLEAPGLSNAWLRPSGDDPPSYVPIGTTGRLGFREVVEHYRAHGVLPPVDDWTNVGLGPEGRIGLVTAAQNPWAEDTARFVHAFDWVAFYTREHGRVMVEALVSCLADSYDYLFVDARTGLTDVHDLALVQLPDLSVLVTNLSQQSVEGIKDCLRLIKSTNDQIANGPLEVRRMGAERRPIQYLLVGSPMPTGEWKARASRVEKIEKEDLNEAMAVQVDYLPFLALEESSQVLAQHLTGDALLADDPVAGTARVFDRLALEIARRNPQAAESLVADSTSLVDAGLWRWGLAHSDEATDRLKDAAPTSRTYFEARLQKARAQARGLTPDREALPNLGKEVQQEPDRLLRVGRAMLSTAEAYLILNDFSATERVAEEALEIGKKVSRQKGFGDAGLDLQALAGLRRGYALGLLSSWEDAQKVLKQAVHNYRKLASRPLLLCLCLCEHARVLQAVGSLDHARRALDEAHSLLSSSGEQDRVKSRYVHAYHQHVAGLVDLCAGKLSNAMTELTAAFTGFKSVYDRVGQVEVFLEGAAVGWDVEQGTQWKMSAPAGQGREPWENAAQDLAMPRVVGALRLHRLAWYLILNPPHFAERDLAEKDEFDEVLDSVSREFGETLNAPAFRCRVRLDQVRALLATGSDNRCLEKAQRLLNACVSDVNGTPGINHDVGHELCLLQAVFTRCSTSRTEAASLVRQAHLLKERNQQLSALWAAVVHAVVTGSTEILEGVYNTFPDREGLAKHGWNRPIAFLEPLCANEHWGLAEAWKSVKDEVLGNGWFRPVLSSPECQ